MATVGRESAGEGPRDVFPGLGTFIGAGMVAGAAAAVLVAELVEQSHGSLLARALGVGLGAILGLFVGLGRSVWRRGLSTPAPDPEREPAREADPSPELWDPWLDTGRDIEWRTLEPALVLPPASVAEEPPIIVEGRDGLTAQRAPVRPRVLSPDTGEAIPLDDEIGPMIQAGRCGLVAIAGEAGSGKTTALRHLAALLPPWARDRVRLFDQPDSDLAALEAAAADRSLVIITPCPTSPLKSRAVYRLALWSQDDLIEYLLAVHWDRCASVMARLKASGDRGFLEGIPELWAVVLDRMARDESIGDVRTALRRELAAQLDDQPALRKRLEDLCLSSHGPVFKRDLATIPQLVSGEPPASLKLARLLRHRPTALLLAADRIAAMVEGGCVSVPANHRLPREVVQEAARRIRGNAQAIRHLNHLMSQHVHWPFHPIAASLLHAASPGWRPDPDCRLRLEGAYLDRVAWPGLNLAGAALDDAELREADLSTANLERAHADRAQFPRADLHGASLTRLRAERADLGRADLRGVTADYAQFRGANLAGALLLEAHLWKADLREAKIEGADFSGANLADARLSGLKLRLARFDGACFGGADLCKCDLEGMELADSDFHDANLQGALLTGSGMPRANFLGANLRDTGLAEVDWPGACLRDADLRGATFHLGSSRSGLVGSPIACEGSRTGFYTDDYHDQDVKPAEEIRKANLRGADLRGAEIKDVDFYLVDLREAQYTPDQAGHFRRCRAILDDRTA
jgi:uncharacterized protein YjbI with pentapeptide repeats/energy-coupling factor transporter ATP-binding protein EcfA2